MSRLDGKNLQLYRARNLLFTYEIFLVHKSWSINQRVVIPVNLISVDRESEKVAPPRRFLDRSSVAFYLFFFSFLPLLWDTRISKRPRVSRVYYSFRGWEKGRSKRDRTRRSERKRVSQPAVNCFCFIASFSLCSPLLQSGKNPGTSHRDTLNYFWSGGWN